MKTNYKLERKLRESGVAYDVALGKEPPTLKNFVTNSLQCEAKWVNWVIVIRVESRNPLWKHWAVRHSRLSIAPKPHLRQTHRRPTVFFLPAFRTWDGKQLHLIIMESQ